jgi:hypothetical protein
MRNPLTPWARLSHRHRLCWTGYIVLVGLLLASLSGLQAFKQPPPINAIVLEYKETYIVVTLDENATHLFITGRDEVTDKLAEFELAKAEVVIRVGKLPRLDITYIAFSTTAGHLGRITFYDLYL